jgi:hypothetical protein
MGSGTALPHQGSNKADALSAELQGHISMACGMLARQRAMSTAPPAAKTLASRVVFIHTGLFSPVIDEALIENRFQRFFCFAVETVKTVSEELKCLS